ncbi:unnamed protein product [Ambrosiozyma monospora]|uniref:Unnamed protein product n=1 Tax=Ambrosiozyma monospora TaxID=43982 RepID=A0A9W6YRX5_AMBMO|nr:unnamed protein product [Ambrosiozyma monospora]
MPKAKGVIRRTISVIKTGKPIADSIAVDGTYSWLTNRNDIKYYSLIKSLPTEIQFQIFSILFQRTHSIIEINDLIDPSWFEKSPSNAPHASQMWYLLGLLFRGIVVDLRFGKLDVYNFPQSTQTNCNYSLLLKYFESAPPDYFKLITSACATYRGELRSICAKLATEFCLHLPLFLREEELLPHLDKLLSGSPSLQTFTSIKSLVFDMCSNPGRLPQLKMIIYCIERFPFLREIAINSFSMDEDPIMCRELAECFNNSKATVYVSSLHRINSHFLQYSLLFRYIRILHFSRKNFEKSHLLENALRKCTSLKLLKIFGCRFPQDYKMKLQNDSLQELELSYVPFDFSGLRNIWRVEINCSEFKHYSDALNELQDSKVERLGLFFLKLFPCTDDTVLDLKIPVSVRRLSLDSALRDPENLENSQFKPYTIILPPVMEELRIDNIPFCLPNIHDVEWLENVYFLCCYYELFAPTIYPLSSYAKEMGKIEFPVKDIQYGTRCKKDFKHLPNLKNRVLNCHEFLQYLEDLPRAVKYLDFTLVIGHLTFDFHSTFEFWINGRRSKAPLTRYLLNACGAKLVEI